MNVLISAVQEVLELDGRYRSMGADRDYEHGSKRDLQNAQKLVTVNIYSIYAPCAKSHHASHELLRSVSVIAPRSTQLANPRIRVLV
jgi:hypothetical protein